MKESDQFLAAQTPVEKIFIEILKYGAKSTIEGVEGRELIEHLRKQRLIKDHLNKEESERLGVLYRECFDRKVLKTEYYFRLLEYSELKLAREAAHSAKRQSTIAIVIATLAIITSVIAAVYQTHTPIKISPEQLSRIEVYLQTKPTPKADN